MSGLYIHIPYCKKKCTYCNFFFSTTLSSKTELLGALKKELILKSKKHFADKIKTIYIGGGTPSLLSLEETTDLINQIKENFNLTSLVEFTVEINPEDVSLKLLRGYKRLGINRLSIGTQSFYNNHLRLFNRVHNSKQAFYAIETAKSVGFTNISIDLIYGIPGMSLKQWEKNLAIFFKFDLSHLSAYSLTVEERTLLNYYVKNKKITLPSDDEVSKQYDFMVQKMTSLGYEHYEISNFSKPRLKSIHNSSYWSDSKYIGIGPSAHSYYNNTREANVSNIRKYISGVNLGSGFYEQEQLSEKTRYNEYILKKLRTTEGISKSYILSNFKEVKADYLEEKIRKYFSDNYLIEKKGKLIITPEKWIISDAIITDFLL